MDHQLLSVDRNQTLYQNFENCCPLNNFRVTLQNQELWSKFHNMETEMIITKSGRRMFPSLNVQIRGLDPRGHYCVLLEMAPASRCRHKYTVSGGWTPAGAEEAQSSLRTYLHPDSPATGEFWMSQPVSFGRMKLTNTPSPPMGHVVLSSMHKYQPKIIIAKTSDPRTIDWSPRSFVAFPETSFIAVTAYQNEKITQLKIDNNPFAKGFRENGQSKCKRKRISEEGSDADKKTLKQAKVLPSQKIEIDCVPSAYPNPHAYKPVCSAALTPTLSPDSTQSSESQHSSLSPTYKSGRSAAMTPSVSSASPPSSESHHGSLSPTGMTSTPLLHKLHHDSLSSGTKLSVPSYPIPYSCNSLWPAAINPLMFYSHYYSQYPICYPSAWGTQLSRSPQYAAEDLRICEPVDIQRKFTDHSIKAITGCE